MYQKLGKRTFDIILAVTGLVILLPLFVFLTILLWFHFGKGPFFCQARPGKNERIFTLFKFRSMHERTFNSDLPRESDIGNFLRKTSLDELPQFWNVLRGDMSVVGPRPLLTEYLPLYNVDQCLRHSVLPGITGLAQIKGRNLLTWNEKFAYDVWYAKNQSFRLDLAILFLTVKQVVKRKGINNPDGSNVEKFKGSSEL